MKLSLALFPILFVCQTVFGAILDYGAPQDALGHYEFDLYDASGLQRGTTTNPLFFKSPQLASALGGQTLANSTSVGLATDQFSLLSTASLQSNGNATLTSMLNTLASILTQSTATANNTASALTDILASGSITSACTTPASCAATSFVTVAAQGQYTVGISVSGTFSAAYLAEAQNGDGTWTQIPMYSVQAGVIGTPYSATLAGPAQVIAIAGAYSNFRIRCANYTSGTINVALDASIAQQAVYSAQLGFWSVAPIDGLKATYSAGVTGLVQAGLATDIFCISGSATKTVRVLRFRISETQTTTSTFNLLLVSRSTADTGGTSTTLVDVPHDTTSAAGTALVKAYTANPTLGTTVGTVDTAKFFGPAVGTNASEFIWQFGDLPGQAFVLRGTSQSLCLNTNAVGQAGASFNIKVLFTEE